MIADHYAKALYLLVLAGVLFMINMRTFTKPFQKRITYSGMWVAIVVSILVAYRVLPA